MFVIECNRPVKADFGVLHFVLLDMHQTQIVECSYWFYGHVAWCHHVRQVVGFCVRETVASCDCVRGRDMW